MTDRKRKRFEDQLVAARPAMTKRAKKWVGSTDAEDLVQQAYLTMLSHHAWETINMPQNWALGVVDGVGRNWRDKKAYKEAHTIDIADQIESIRAECTGTDIVDQMIEDEETALNIKTIMDAMALANLTRSEDYIVLARLRGVEYDEIAEILGLGRESAVTYYSNALCKIRRVVKQQDKTNEQHS